MKVCVFTLGCKVNRYESDVIINKLIERGYEVTENLEKADYYVINTCAVTAEAEKKSRQCVARVKKQNPDAKILICGCASENNAKQFEKDGVVYVSGTAKKDLLSLLPESGVNVEDIPKSYEESGFAENVRTRAYVKIQDGCNNFCTYCIVPYVRGRERSRQACDVLAEAKQLIADGYKEITLLGQNVNSYGKDLTPRVTFSQLLRQMNDLPGDFRIRFMTSHPKDCTKELLDTMAECPKVAKHLHLPFQCGNDRVLKAMNRGYTAGQYLELVHYAKAKMGSALSITSDVIVGFPGETYEEFQDTLSLVKEVGATSLFTFIYSPRQGTPAAKMDDPVPHKEKARWMAELLALQEQISAEQMQLHRGETFKCFVSGKGKLGDNYVAARTDGNLIIEFEGDDSLIGSFQNVKVIEPLTYVLRGELERN